jgi:hypothetical protein
MAGNDKLTTSLETWDRTGRRHSAQLFYKTGQFNPVSAFYDISGAGLHLPETGKSCGVAQRRQCRLIEPGRTIAIRRRRDIIWN